jgi:MOSC domain-containing protein YiiM
LKILSLNVGQPRDVTWNGKTVSTAIFKQPAAGRLRFARLGLEGDRQANLSVHGGPDKAIYVYPSEHYSFWQDELSLPELPWGAFGENVTASGLLETEVRIGDRYRAGDAELLVVQPRMPCSKLNLRHRRDDLVARFLAVGRPGFYCAVVREGSAAAGDAIERLASDPRSLTVAEVFRAAAADDPDPELLRRASELQALPEAWRRQFRSGRPARRREQRVRSD